MYRSYFFQRRSDIVVEEKPESSLVKNVSFTGHVNKVELLHQGAQVDAPQGQQYASYNTHDSSSLVCSRNTETRGM